MELQAFRHDAGFCPVYLSPKGNQVINARELHQSLGLKRKFTDWFDASVKSHNLVIDRDYCLLHADVKQKSGSGGHNKKEYVLRLEVAKRIAMATMTDQGKQVRDYFLWCEKVKDRAVSYFQGMEQEEAESARIAQCTDTTYQRAQVRQVASVIFAGRQSNVPNIIQHNRRVCNMLTHENPTPYKNRVSKIVCRKFSSAREAMRAYAPELSATACFIDMQVAQGVSLDAIERSGITKTLPAVFRQIRQLHSYQR